MKSKEPLKDKVFVFTGEMSMARDLAKEKVLVLGGRSTITVSSKTTHLVCGEDPGEKKIEKSKSLKVEIINEDEFLGMIQGALDNFNSSIEIDKIDLDSDVEELKLHDFKKDNLVTSVTWTEKYRPKCKSELVGNPSAINEIERYLKGEYKEAAALVSGSPGMGKTTAVGVICKELGFTLIEFNASDTRNKKMLVASLKSQTQNEGVGKKRVVVMDEVDGMSSDRGGVPELVQIIKKSKVPIICICNDRQSLNIRTLANYCVDIKFRKPVANSILPRLKEILKQEGKILPDSVLKEIICACNSDIRFIINTLQKNKDLKDIKNIEMTHKTPQLNIFETATQLFKSHSAERKLDLFFEDFSIMPLFVHENFAKKGFSKKSDLTLQQLAEVSDYISYGDVIDKSIHGTQQNYSLLPYYAVFSALLPTKNSKVVRPDFPSYLGITSSKNGNHRLLINVCSHLKYKDNCEKIRRYYAPIIVNELIKCICKNDTDGALDIIKSYELIKDDFDSLIKILKLTETYKSVPSKNKSAFTREYKKLKRVLPYFINEKVGEFNEE
ncbi:RFC1 [Hepatospora eriocheir]|uniref:Replication factor C subunit 1 n=1 Tax=Hepatospora eriocheir TaxID=1081669 RepID=A0A1X0Q7E5_9MICR|nr:RFC1 [Hepatospora eriocheir]